MNPRFIRRLFGKPGYCANEDNGKIKGSNSGQGTLIRVAPIFSLKLRRYSNVARI